MANAQLGFTFVPTSRGGRYLCMGGYMYRVNKRRRDEWLSWKCINKDYTSTVSLTNDVLSKLPSDHNHPPPKADVKAKQTLADLKVQVATSLTPMPTLYDEALLSLKDGAWTPESRAAVVAMPGYKSTKDSLYRARRATFPTLPTHRRDVEIPQEFQVTNSGEQFLFINDGTDEEILGFSTMGNLQNLAAADTIFADGTFYVVSSLFYQLYTFHAMVNNKMYPLVYLLLPNKKTDTYLRAFRLVKTAAENRGLQLALQCIQMDYEAAARIAATNVFPTASWRGCFFHYTQCVWRKAQQLGLQTDYNVDPDVTRLVRRFAALPMLPPDQVLDVVLQTIGDMPGDPRCHQLADYMTNNWMEGDLPFEAWNHHSTDGPRTNNHLEGWHGRLKKIISKAHPNVFELIKFLKKEQDKNEITTVQIEGGHRLPPRKKRYTNMDRRISILKERLASGQISPISFTDDVSVLLKLS